jgi:hypothetical protein
LRNRFLSRRPAFHNPEVFHRVSHKRVEKDESLK